MTERREPPGEDLLLAWARGGGPLLYLEVAPDGTVLISNPFTSQLVGSEVQGRPFRDVVVDFHRTLDPLLLSRDPGQTHPLSVTSAKGPPLDFLGVFLPSPGGARIVGVPNLGEVESMNAAILGLNSDLNRLTRDLQKANAELARLNQLKNPFLGMATHDLRKPLGLILGFTELVTEDASDRLTGEEREYLEKVISSAEGMKKLVEDFLNVSVIESGRLALAPERVTLSSVLGRALEVVRVSAGKKGVEVRVEEDPDLPPLLADPERLEQVLVNLVANAVEFSHPGSTVMVRTRMDWNRALLEVEDHGVGIPPEALGDLFSPFGKAGSKKTGGEQSTGLGLVIARKIVEAHGGEVGVRSTLGEGTVFTVSLPLGEGHQPSKEPL